MLKNYVIKIKALSSFLKLGLTLPKFSKHYQSKNQITYLELPGKAGMAPWSKNCEFHHRSRIPDD